MNPIQEIFQGFVGGLIAGLIGYAVDVASGAMFEAFKVFSPLIPILGFVYAIVSFVSGIEEAYITGFFFSCGIVASGFLLSDFVTIVAGAISIAGLIISLFHKSGD